MARPTKSGDKSGEKVAKKWVKVSLGRGSGGLSDKKRRVVTVVVYAVHVLFGVFISFTNDIAV